MNDPSRACDLDEFDFVDFPRCTPRHCCIGCGSRVAVHAFLGSRVVDVPEIDQWSRDLEPGLFPCFTTCRRFESFLGIRRAFRDSPWRTTVVVTGRMNEQHLDATVDDPVQHGTGCELGAWLWHRLGTVQDTLGHCKCWPSDFGCTFS